jgi:hypothetical protein
VSTQSDGSTQTTFERPDPGQDSAHFSDIAIGAGRQLLAVGTDVTSSDWRAIVQLGTTSDASWSGIFPDVEPDVVHAADAFVPGTDTAFIVASNNSVQSQPLVFGIAQPRCDEGRRKRRRVSEQAHRGSSLDLRT